MKIINISTIKYLNKYVIVDDDCSKDIFKYKWGINNEGYARRNKNGKIIFLHRLIMGFPDGNLDHINRNKLDNRKSNLRIASKSINAFNSGLYCHNKSGYRGISWNKWAKKWRSQIQINKKSIRLGDFNNIKEAVKVRKNYEEHLPEWE